MKKKIVKKVGFIILFAGILSAAFFVTRAHYFKKGLNDGRGVQALEQVGLHHIYKMLLDDERYADLNEQVELNMWLAIPTLYEFTENKDVSEDVREAAARTLSTAVKHFYMNPRIIKVPESLNLNESTQKIIAEKIKQEDIKGDLKNRLKDVAPLLEARMDELSGFLDNIVLQMYFDELKVQSVFNRLVEQRYFPGTERKVTGLTVMTPSGGGSWSGRGSKSEIGGFNFDYKKPKLKGYFDGSELVVNGESYGELNKNDVIDFRMPDHVFVNDQERKPQK